MPGVYACCTFFQHVTPEELAVSYEESAEPANGYLVSLNTWWMLDDATATEASDWGRQLELATQLTGEEGTAISVFLVGELWTLALCHGGNRGPVALFVPGDSKLLEQLPHQLLAFEQAFGELFPDDVDTDEVDSIFGALLDGAMLPEEAFSSLLQMVGVAADWQRWCWCETVPYQLFTDPDLSSRVIPLGLAKAFWEE